MAVTINPLLCKGKTVLGFHDLPKGQTMRPGGKKRLLRSDGTVYVNGRIRMQCGSEAYAVLIIDENSSGEHRGTILWDGNGDIHQLHVGETINAEKAGFSDDDVYPFQYKVDGPLHCEDYHTDENGWSPRPEGWDTKPEQNTLPPSDGSFHYIDKVNNMPLSCSAWTEKGLATTLAKIPAGFNLDGEVGVFAKKMSKHEWAVVIEHHQRGRWCPYQGIWIRGSKAKECRNLIEANSEKACRALAYHMNATYVPPGASDWREYHYSREQARKDDALVGISIMVSAMFDTMQQTNMEQVASALADSILGNMAAPGKTSKKPKLVKPLTKGATPGVTALQWWPAKDEEDDVYIHLVGGHALKR